jgi:hypothetical protein
MTFLRSHILTLLFLATVSVASASDVLLLLEAENNAVIIARVDSADPAIATAAAVLDTEKAAQGWMWTEYTTTIDGYVPTESLSKNFDIATDTFVRSSPNTRANVLTRAEADDRFDVVASNDDWTTVRLKKAIPTYFLSSSLNRAIAAPPIAVPVPQQPLSKINFDPTSKVAKDSPDTLPSENVSVSSTPAYGLDSTIASEPQASSTNSDSIIVAATEFMATGTPRPPEPTPGTPTRVLNGKLVREIHSFGPRYPIRLKASSGRRLAYVDMSRIFINDLRPYLDKTVYISGEVHPIVPGSSDLVIVARTIRIEQ